MTGQTSKGTCTFCHRELSKASLTRHLVSCGHHPEFCVKTGRRQPGEDARLMGPYPKARTNRKMQLGLAKILSKQASKGALVTQDGAQTTPLSDPAFLAGCLYVDDDQYAAFSQPESLAGGYLASQPKR